MCGGTVRDAQRTPPQYGLSPRVRGNLRVRLNELGYQGSIPACAGEPMPGVGVIDGGEVYPRVCGGTAGGNCGIAILRGLSPRVRGNRGLITP